MRVFITEMQQRDGGGFHMLVAGPFGLSVQGSRTHYCLPREDLTAPRYTHWEVMMYELAGGEIVNPAAMEVPVARIGRYWRMEGDTPLGCWVPAAVVQALFTWCIMQGPGGVDDELMGVSEGEP